MSGVPNTNIGPGSSNPKRSNQGVLSNATETTTLTDLNQVQEI